MDIKTKSQAPFLEDEPYRGLYRRFRQNRTEQNNSPLLKGGKRNDPSADGSNAGNPGRSPGWAYFTTENLDSLTLVDVSKRIIYIPEAVLPVCHR
jgi:hypothetical protein